jgi:hypothetical protein
MIMRVLVAVDWNHKNALDEINYHLNWIRETLPIIMTRKMARLIEGGFYYMYGRDRSLRPIMMFYPKVILRLHADLNDAMMAAQYVAQYVIDNRMYKGRIENWLTIVDLEHLGITEISNKWINTFIQTFKHNYYQRNVDIVLVNAPYLIHTIWSFIKMLLPEATRNKIIIERSNSSK